MHAFLRIFSRYNWKGIIPGMLFFGSFILLLNACRQEKFQWQTGDLIFQDLDCPLCKAIENATTGYQNKPVSHMGIIYIRQDTVYVIEAYDGVQLTPLDSFLHRSPKIMAGRLKPPYRKFIPQAIRNALQKTGLPYDDEFALNNGKYYCSELVHDAFVDGDGKPIFSIQPMNFKNLSTGKIDSIWTDYFSRLGIPVPQGKPGCNPAAYSRSEKLDILYTTY